MTRINGGKTQLLLNRQLPDTIIRDAVNIIELQLNYKVTFYGKFTTSQRAIRPYGDHHGIVSHNVENQASSLVSSMFALYAGGPEINPKDRFSHDFCLY